MTAAQKTDKAKIRLVITDLDNTLYDWIESFVPPFYAMVSSAAAFLGVEEKQLLDELQAVHQRHGSSEHPYALLETTTVEQQMWDKDRATRRRLLSEVFHEFNKLRKQNLRLYQGVATTLGALKSFGVPAVAYTDARVQNSLFRMVKLSLLPLISRLYAPQHNVESEPPGPTPDYVSSIPKDYVRLLPPEDRKPNPEALIDICNDFGVAPAAALYIGDSMVRDI